MNYPCGVIRDLIPLYADGVCGKESREAVESHLENCRECREYFEKIKGGASLRGPARETEREKNMADTFKKIKEKLLRKQIITAAAAAVAAVVLAVALVFYLGTAERTVEYKGNITCGYTREGLCGRLYGSRVKGLSIKNIIIREGDTEEILTFLTVSDTALDDLLTGKDGFSEFTIVPRDRSADKVAAVYYCEGSMDGIESMSARELEKVKESCRVLWEKER